MGRVTVSTRWTVPPAWSCAGDACAWNGPFVPETVPDWLGPAAWAPHPASTNASSSKTRFMPLRRSRAGKVPSWGRPALAGSGGFAGRRFVVDTGFRDAGAWIDRQRLVEDRRHIGWARGRMKQRP